MNLEVDSADARFIVDYSVAHNIEIEADKEINLKRMFDEYANEWWKDYKGIRDSHNKRVVPIYVETDDRDSM